VQAGLPLDGKGRKRSGGGGEDGRDGKRRRGAEGEKSESSFWIPEETPNVTEDAPAPGAASAKLQTVCPLSAPSDPHPFSLKTLVEVHFATAADEPAAGAGGSAAPEPPGTASRRICPACRKTLTNATKAMLAVPCGHVVCKPCADKFVAPPAGERDVRVPEGERGIVRCYVCEADLTTVKKSKKKGGLKPGLVEIQSEGTGFAGGGKSVVVKEGVVFQC
jgi:nitric oxide synthase-interacting protein